MSELLIPTVSLVQLPYEYLAEDVAKAHKDSPESYRVFLWSLVDLVESTLAQFESLNLKEHSLELRVKRARLKLYDLFDEFYKRAFEEDYSGPYAVAYFLAVSRGHLGSTYGWIEPDNPWQPWDPVEPITDSVEAGIRHALEGWTCVSWRVCHTLSAFYYIAECGV